MKNYSAHKIIALAVQAGQEAIRLRKEGLIVEIKPDGSKVTNADIAADKIVFDGLGEYDPNTLIISEEDKKKNLQGTYDSAWVVDPIDGTNAFIKGQTDWGVLIARVENHIPVEGVAYYPDLNTVYYTENGRSFRRSVTVDEQGQFSLGTAHDLKTYKTTASTLRHGQFISDISARFPKGAEAVKYTEPSNSIAVIEGAIDVAVNPPTMGDWDLAAPDAILRNEGGGYVSTTSGELLQYGLPRSPERAFLLEESVAGNLETLEKFELASKELKPASLRR